MKVVHFFKNSITYEKNEISIHLPMRQNKKIKKMEKIGAYGHMGLFFFFLDHLAWENDNDKPIIKRTDRNVIK